uniref:Candidate secreted effector n=1 Tax=Meloidogyne incognita TaxID=6306 RepID=A0A914LTE1_MELIC
MALTATSTLFFSTATGRTSITTYKTRSRGVSHIFSSRSRGVSHISSSTDTPCTSMSNSHNPASCVRCVHARSRRTKRS